MNRYLPVLFACALAAPSAADPGTAFTYQGRLDNGGVPVQGTVSLRFSLHDAATAGTPVGATIDRIDTTAIDGVVIETLDFGDAFDGGARWLQIEVDADGGSDSFVTLGDRVAILPVPYAVYAENAGTASVALNDAVDDADADPANEIQTLTFASPSLSITGGNSVDLSSLIPSGADGHSLDANDGSPVDALYVDASGNVGIATTTPDEALEIVGKLKFSGEVLDQKSGVQAGFGYVTGDTWQSFTAGKSGPLTSIELAPASAAAGTYYIYAGEGIDGTLLGSGAFATVDGVYFDRFDLDPPVEVTAEQMYTIRADFTGTVVMSYSSTNPYKKGRSVQAANYDLPFATFISPGIEFADGTVQTTAYPGSVDDADADPTNELQNVESVLAEGTDAGGADISNLGAVSAASFSGDGSALTGITDNVDDADADPTNELQDIASVLGEGNDAGGADISNLGTVSAASFSGDGSALTGIPVPSISSLDAKDGNPADVLVVDNHGRVQVGGSGVFVGQLGQLRCEDGGLEIATRPMVVDASQDTGSTYNPSSAQSWQSFTAGITGQLVAVAAHRRSGAPQTAVILYEGEGIGGTVLSATMIPDNPSSGWQLAAFPVPVNATAGDVFTMQLSNGSSWNLASFDNLYPDGRSKDGGSSDHRFRTYMLDTTGGDDYATALHVDLSNQFVGILDTSPAYPLQVGTNSSTGNGAHVTTGGTWTNGSSRTFKENFATLDPAEILAKVCTLPVTGWNYVGSDEGQHIGPMAEDFHAAFGLGDSEKYISTVDADGVAFVAIQALNELVQEKQAKVDDLEAQLTVLAKEKQARIDDLEARLAAIESRMGYGAPNRTRSPAEDGAANP